MEWTALSMRAGKLVPPGTQSGMEGLNFHHLKERLGRSSSRLLLSIADRQTTRRSNARFLVPFAAPGYPARPSPTVPRL
jgi:hypothetical protein